MSINKSHVSGGEKNHEQRSSNRQCNPYSLYCCGNRLSRHPFLSRMASNHRITWQRRKRSILGYCGSSFCSFYRYFGYWCMDRLHNGNHSPAETNRRNHHRRTSIYPSIMIQRHLSPLFFCANTIKQNPECLC